MKIYLILAVSGVMFYFPSPLEWEDSTAVSSVYIWFEVEISIVIGTILSSVLFIAIRTLVHPKIQIEQVPERKKIPGIDTIIAIHKVMEAFNG